MYYELNVSLNGRHVFATHKRSVLTKQECARLYTLFKEAFPEREGFKITVSEMELLSQRINPDTLPVIARDVVLASMQSSVAHMFDRGR